MAVELEWVEVNEQRRVYAFADRNIVFEDVARLCIRPSGYHRLETKDGLKHIVAPGWLAIHLDTAEWNR